MKKYFLLVLFILCIHILNAQDTTGIEKDTLQISMQQAESMFLTRNLELIAQKYSIDSAKATVITAKLYDNPEFDFSNGVFDPGTHGIFGPEWTAQVSQLIRLAGKRNKSIDFAKSGIDIAENQFYDLLRTLRFMLRNDFYNIYFMEQSAKVYEIEISSLQKIVSAYREQVNKGYIASADLLRIQSQLYTLQAEHDNLQTNIIAVQAEFKTLIRANPTQYFVPQVSFTDLNTNVVARTSYQSLMDSAMANRPDIKALNAGIVQGNYNLALQKAIAVPDISMGVNYDHLGGYVKNYTGIGVSLPLPLFNRNQGNIRNAQIQTELNKTAYESGIEQVKHDVTANYITALRSEQLLLGFDPSFEENMKNLISQVTINFQKKNLTLLEFLDYYDSYKQNVLQINQLRFNKMNALEQLNLSVGKIIFNK
jgi:cobalt-zinc-cadmium efflux system outer membrane protein